MLELTTIQTHFYAELRKQDKQERLLHEPSGKLSASRLAQPLQWQVLHYLGVEPTPFEDYTLGVFLRGREVEKTVCQVAGLPLLQREVMYRNVVGKIDTEIEIDKKTIPVEIKSVKNSKFKRIVAQGADESHVLQSVLYGLAQGSLLSGVVYVASDDYRMKEWYFDVSQYKERIDKIIDTFNAQVAQKQVPIFEPIYAWQAKEEYNNYFKFMSMTHDEIQAKTVHLWLDR